MANRESDNGKNPLTRQQTAVLTIFIKRGRDLGLIAAELSKGKSTPVTEERAREVLQIAFQALGGKNGVPWDLIKAAQAKRWLPLQRRGIRGPRKKNSH